MSQKFFLVLTALAVAVTLAACGLSPANNQPGSNQPAGEQTGDGSVGLANPASVNCEKEGGTLLLMNKTVDGQDFGQYGICYFEDNRQCEEWAMLRGNCPVGGLKVTGYITPAATYCAITGGTYAPALNKKAAALAADQEQGNCTLKDGTICDAWQYYVGQCPTE